jgi:hypothetical protein
VDPHRRAELRSLAYHRAIAERLSESSELLERARIRVARWRSSGEVCLDYVDAWERVLSRSIDDIRAALISESEPMMAARQSSPFAGALTPRERWELWKSVEA